MRTIGKNSLNEPGRQSSWQWTVKVSQLPSWCFMPSQPQRIKSGLMDTFLERYIAERTSRAEIRPDEQSEKAESSRENLWNEIQLKGP